MKVSREQFEYIKAEYDLLVHDRELLVRKINKFIAWDILLTILLLLAILITKSLFDKCIYLVILAIYVYTYLTPLIELRLLNKEIDKRLNEMESLG